MRRYYHTYPTCPSCHAPHKGIGPLEKKRDDFVFYCDACGTSFRTHVVFDEIKFPETAKLLGKYKNEPFPVVWGVDLNPIELSYVEWLSDAPRGVYFITWPWDRVKFIPILINEYILRSGEQGIKSKILVIADFHKSRNDNIFGVPDMVDAFVYMRYLKDFADEGDRDKTIWHERNRFDKRKMIGVKSRFVRYRLKVKGSSEKIERICPEPSVTKCKNRLIKEFENDSIHTLSSIKIRKYNKVPQIKILEENGDVEAEIEEREEYPSNIYYMINWIW